ncbi:MAG: GspE/PulE family protein [Candidatus Eisenbacteria bacterium]|uniref:GspE/PulE family protein n=1 Tax=Eiseniibacteriota bacterium TaxID=2212470 RepID=A0A948RX42_UNCEI|nr:GspE/PulE family protein [Candidatus Eisenbacteria bacterium]MBU2692643.1 GspE/PulE family protein [Candidatus Eisenbacteria bacterium]
MITRGQLDEALALQSDSRERLGGILCKLGYIGESDLLNTLATQFNLRMFEPAKDAIEPAAIDFIPLEFARRYNVLPIRLADEFLTVALSDPLDVEARDQLQKITMRKGLSVEYLLAPPDVLERTRETNYNRVEGSRNVNQLIDKVMGEIEVMLPSDDEPDEDEVQRRAQDAGVIKLVDQMIGMSLEDRATDIHIEPQEHNLVIRFRMDGLLYDALTPPRAVYTGVISRIKILANMDIAERRACQDGRFTYKKNQREVDIRVSAIPTLHGEKLVLRLLDKTTFNFSLRDLGFSETNYKVFTNAIHNPYGMILLSGPTGSGKSTTLYASLLELRNETRNITTIEDPVEYQIDRINQVQVNIRKKITFSNTLRSFLRQDPDIIMVGEIRDADTADIAVRAALTGHMVFSTIHANDAPATATRLVSMGIESFMAASALTLVAAQRLVRRNCRHCLEEYQPPDEVLLAVSSPGQLNVNDKPIRFMRGGGCALCKGRGYTGRVAIVEMMPITTGIRQLIAENRPAGEIRHLALKEGMKTLRQSGFEKVETGLTTLEEVMRVCLGDE